MKNRLLSLAALAVATLSGTSALAQSWDAPAPKASELQDGGEYYLYNTGAGQFIKNGNDYWRTQAWMVDTGLKAVVSRADAEDESKGWTVKFIGPFYGYADNGDGKKQNCYLFIESLNYLYTDMGNQGHNNFKITKQDNGENVYRLSAVDGDDVYSWTASDGAYEGCYFGYNPSSEYPSVSPLLNYTGIAEYGYCIDWNFVSEEDYQYFLSRKALYKMLLKAEEAGVSTSAASAVYGNASATIEDLDEATNTLSQATIQTLGANATVQNPISLNAFAQNMSFEQGIDGWNSALNKLANWKSQTRTDLQESTGVQLQGFFERYVGPGNGVPNDTLYQTLKGLPQGLYRLSADVTAVNQADRSNPSKGVYLYVYAGTKYELPVATYTVGEVGSPNYLDSDKPSHFSMNFTVTSDSIAFGIAFKDANANWVAMDNFQLDILSVGSNPALDLLVMTIEEAKTVPAWRDEEGVVLYSQATNNALTAIIEEAEALAGASATDEELNAMVAKLEAQMQVVSEETLAYTEVDNFMNTVIPATIAQYEEDFPTVSSSLGQYNGQLRVKKRTGALTLDEIKAIQTTIDTMVIDGVRADIAPGKEITVLLKNASLATGTSGWTFANNNTPNATGVYGAEAYQKRNFDMSQTLENMPAGTYTLRAQAFYRTANNADALANWQAEGSAYNNYMELYGNVQSKTVKNVFDEYSETGLYPADGSESTSWGSGSNDYRYADGEAYHYVPNSVGGIEAYFNAGYYWNEIDFVVFEDGSLKVGLRIGDVPTTIGGFWGAFNNFQLIYKGDDDLSGYVEALQAVYDKADLLVAEINNVPGHVLTADANATLNAEMGNAAIVLDKADNNEATKEEINAAVSSLQAAIDATAASFAANEKLYAYAKDLYARLMDLDYYSGYAEAEIATVYFDKLYSLVEEGEGYLSLNANGMYKTIEDVEADYAYLTDNLVPFIQAGAADEETSMSTPYDMTAVIINPTFGTAAAPTRSGWDGTLTAASNGVAEFYNGDFDLYQDIRNLAPGYYQLQLTGFYRNGGYAEAVASYLADEYELNAQVYASQQVALLPSILDGRSEVALNGGVDEAQIQTLLQPEVTDPEEQEALPKIYIPNMLSTSAIYQNSVPEYGVTFNFYVAEGQEVTRIGVRKLKTTPYDWASFSNFKLFYFADDEPTGVSGVESDAQIVKVEVFDLAGAATSMSTKGVKIIRTTLADGSVKVVKTIVK